MPIDINCDSFKNSIIDILCKTSVCKSERGLVTIRYCHEDGIVIEVNTTGDSELHVAVLKTIDGHNAFQFGYYKSPNGEVHGPYYRD